MNSNAALNVIAELDLDPIKVKLMHKESGEGWTLEYANAVEFEYRRYLCLMKLFPHDEKAPLVDVDIFWHYHILDTVKYAADCERIFGYFLHHFPYLGLRGEDDEAAHHRVGARMQELYEATFGEPYIRQQGDHSATTQSVLAAQDDSFDSLSPMTGTAKTAHSIGMSPLSATPKTAHSIGMSPLSATPKTAHSIGMSPLFGAAKTAHSIGMSPLFATAKTAHSIGMSPLSATAKTAHSIGMAPIGISFSNRPRLGTAKTAHSIGMAPIEVADSVQPASGMTNTAHSIGMAPNETFYSVRPMLASAA